MAAGMLAVVSACGGSNPGRIQPAGDAPPILHSVEGREECLICHLTGLASSPEVPEHHRGRANNTCGLCHRPFGATIAGVATLASSPGAAVVPHPLEGREECVMCHVTGSPQITQMPADHTGRTDADCHLCHTIKEAPTGTIPPPPALTLSGEAALVPTPAPAVTPGPTAPTPATPTAPAPAARPAPIPHPIAEREACLTCHASGNIAISEIPGDHRGGVNRPVPFAILSNS